jgi:vacuolar-type H+-ATPase subunit I/STV1
MKSVSLSLKLISFIVLLLFSISSYGFVNPSSPLKKNGNLSGKEKFQQKNNPSSNRYSQFENKSNSRDFNQKFSRKEIRFETWDKHFSKLGQKKIFSDKSGSNFDQSLNKNIQSMSEIEIEESNWSQHLAKLRKDAGINISQESQIVDDKATYSLILHNLGYFEEMAEKMDLRSINRYQFRSNRPEGEIPVDKVAENADSLN